MAPNTRTATVLLQYQVAGAQAIVRDNQAVIAQLGALQNATVAEQLSAAKLQQQLESIDRARSLQKLAADAAAGVTPLDQVLQKLDQINATDAEIKRLATDMDAFADSAQRAAVATQQIQAPRGVRDIGVQSQDELPFPDLGGSSSGASAGGLVGNLRQSAIALPGVGFQSPIVVGLRLVEKVADSTGASLAQVGIAGALTGAALIAVKLAFDHFTEGIANAKKVLDGALSAQNTYYAALANSTTTQVKEQLAGLERVRDAQQQQVSELQNAINATFSQLQAQFGDAGARALVAAGQTPITQLQAQLDDLNKQFQSNDQSITRLNQGLDNGAFAANDAREAEEKLQKAREESASQLIKAFDDEANTRVRLAELRRSGTTNQVNAELDANKDRETIIRNFLLPAVASLGLTTEAATKRTQELNTELTDLQHNDKLLVDAVLPVVAQREAEVALLKAQKDASDALNPILQDINKAQVDLATASEKTAAALADVQQAERDHSDKLIDIQAQYADAQMTALQKKNEQFAKIDQQAATRALEQRENLNLQIEGLVARGQIAEAQQAIRAQALKETQDARQVQQQKDDAQKSYEDQLKAADQQRDKLLRSEQERYQKELTQRRDAYNKAIQDQQALQNRLAQLRSQEAFQVQYNANVQIAALAKVSQATGDFAANMQAYANQISMTNSGRSGGSTGGGTPLPGEVVGLPAVTGTAANYPGSGITIGSFAVGSPFVPRDMLAIVHRGERIIPASQNNGGSPVIFNIDAKGSTLSEAEWQRRIEPVKAEVVQKLTEIHNRQKK